MINKKCCKTNNKDAAKKGLLFGLLAHAPCILIILITIIGVSLGGTIISTFLSPYLFYGLIIFSFGLSIIAATIYLKRNDALNADGIKNNWKYLSILFGIVIVINILFLTVIFPFITNATFNKNIDNNLANFTIFVDIPCSGHAYLINKELSKDLGVINIDYAYPKMFTIYYAPTETNKEKIVQNPIFKEYPLIQT